MEKQVIFRDRQELQSADLNNTQAYAAASLRHLRQDAVSAGAHFTGGVVSPTSAAEISVAPLRFYNDGAVYLVEQATVLNLFQYLPLVTKKVVAVVVWGEETDTVVEPRDFLIDLTTGATQPQAVAMQRARVANVNLLPGSESADPQPPVIQTNTLAIALVYLSPTGIERVEMQDSLRLPSLAQHAAQLGTLELWRRAAEPRIESIATDLAALSGKTTRLARFDQVVQLAGDVARLKAQLNLPASYAGYDADLFDDTAKTDPAGVGYGAQVKLGLLFPYAGQASTALALFNPYDAAIKRSAQDLVLPAYESRVRLKTEGYAGDLSISQYQVQAQVLRAVQIEVQEQAYGWHRSYYKPSRTVVHNGRTYYFTGGWKYERYGYITTRSETVYRSETVTQTFNGAIVAQTFLAANAMWLTQVGLQFTQVAAAGDVKVVICETEGGKPQLERVLAHVTVPRADLKKYPTETLVPLPPVLLEAGRRYALALITQGDHRVAVISGGDYTQGTLFFGTDGDYFTGDLSKDLMFSLYAARFAQPRVEVMLQSVTLAGGITDLAIAAPEVVPPGTALHYEIQVGGRWYRLDEPNTTHLADAPDIVPLRAVLIGTADLAPALQLGPNAVVGSRPGLALVHWSTERVLAAPSTQIEVQVVVAQWDTPHHTLECTLHNGGTTYTPTATLQRMEPDGEALRFTFSFEPSPGIDRYQIRLAGTRTADTNPFAIVERTDVVM